MSPPTQSLHEHYDLIDFGGGRKLERFGNVVLDRPSPAAVDQHRSLRDWSIANLRLDDCGEITSGGLANAPWRVRIANLLFNLRITPFGHVGLFPEQAPNWQWLQSLTADAADQQQQRNALNLFAYTGGSTMAMAKAGFEVVHVDASAPSVRWARDNAETNQLDSLPIRWIVEDARKFASREVKRGRSYDLIVLDPPSFGHGPSGDRWQIESDLFPLLEVCLQLLNEHGRLLLTAHSTSPAPEDIAEWLRSELDKKQRQDEYRVSCQRLELVDQHQRPLDAGFSIRCEC